MDDSKMPPDDLDELVESEGFRSSRNTRPVRPVRSQVKNIRVPGQRGMSFSATIVVALVFAFTIVYMVWQAYGFFTPNITTEVVRLGTMDIQHSIPGIIVRNETVYRAPRDGHVVFTLPDFERVRAGVHIASIQDADAEAMLQQNIHDMAEIEARIMQIHEMRHHTLSDPAVQLINTNITNTIERNMHYFTAGDISAIYSLMERTRQAVESRNTRIIEESIDARADISREHDLISQQLDQNSYQMLATRTGIFSPYVDGFETYFTPDNMRHIYRELVLRGVDHTTVVPVRSVYEDQDVFKIVTNTWFVVTYLPNEIVQTLTQGQHRVFYLENALTGRFIPINMRVDLIDYTPRDSMVVLRSTRYLEDFLHQRSVNIQVTDNVQSGLKIASSAIAIRRFVRIPLTHVHGISNIEDIANADLYVQHRRFDGIVRVPLDVSELHTHHLYVLEEALQLGIGDSLVAVDPNIGDRVLADVDTRIVFGVYRTNLGFADFRQIHLPDESSVIEGHVILDPTRNPGLRQFDQIVTDATAVRQGQPIN